MRYADHGRRYVTDEALNAWRTRQLELLADDPDNPRMPANPLSEWDAHREGCRVMRRIVAAQRARMDRVIDRQLVKRQDAIGDLFRRGSARPILEVAA